MLVVWMLSHITAASAKTPQGYGFIENKGQVTDQVYQPNPDVLYLLNEPGLRVQLHRDGFSYEILKPSWAGDNNNGVRVHRVDILFRGAKADAVIEAQHPGAGYINYYMAENGSGITGVRHFNKVVYRNIYKGIDVEFVADQSKQSRFKYNFIVHPGADLRDIQLGIEGASGTSLSGDKGIMIETVNGTTVETIPYSYQVDQANIRKPVAASFEQLSPGVFGIKAEHVNPMQLLVIDPAPWGTYFGGSDSDQGYGIKVDNNNNVIATGNTFSATTIATSGAYQNTYGGVADVFIAKFDSSGVLLWATYYGGDGNEAVQGIAIDNNANICITGWGGSGTIANTPTTPGAHQTIPGGAQDIFIAKFSDAGLIQWATLYGGNKNDVGFAIATDAGNNVFITGNSATLSGIATSGAHQTTYAGGATMLIGDGIIAKFNAAGALQWCTYYGGSSDDIGRAIAIDQTGNVIVAGGTRSSSGISTAGSFKSFLPGTAIEDAFIVKFTTLGSRIWGTYYGGTGQDRAYGVATDLNNNIVITGWAASSTGIATTGSHQPAMLNGDAFVAKFDSAGARYWGTYYGGSDIEMGLGVTTHSNGDIFVCGYSLSTSNIATPGSYQTVFGGGVSSGDAFLVSFNAAGVRNWGTYLGGPGEETGNAVALDNSGNVYLAGATNSSAGIIAPGSYQNIPGGGYDAFIQVFTNAGTLPVHFISFQATASDHQKTVDCRWATASEVNNNYFEVERSDNGVDFAVIGKVGGAGTTSQVRKYTFADGCDACFATSATVFYRVKQTDYDGTYTYSGIVPVSFSHSGGVTGVYPNPFSDMLTIQEAQPVDVRIYDLAGNKLADRQQHSGTLDLNYLVPGIYIIELHQKEKTERIRIIKN